MAGIVGWAGVGLADGGKANRGAPNGGAVATAPAAQQLLQPVDFARNSDWHNFVLALVDSGAQRDPVVEKYSDVLVKRMWEFGPQDPDASDDIMATVLGDPSRETEDNLLRKMLSITGLEIETADDGSSMEMAMLLTGSDDCSLATVIGSVPFTDTASATGATDDLNVNPSCDSSSNGALANNGTWWVYTPASSCTAIISETGTNDVAISVWTGASCAALVQTTCSDPETNVAVPLTGGTTYYLLISTWGSANPSGATYNLSFDCAPLVSNDTCAAPAAIASVPYSASADAAAATDDTNVNPSCDSSSNGAMANNGVWWTYTPSVTCSAVMSELSSNDVAISAWTGASCATLSQSFCSDPETGVGFTMTGGTTYYLLVSTWGTGVGTGNFVFTFNCIPVPANDECESPTALSLPASTTVDVGGASADTTPTPPSCGFSGAVNKSVWYSVVGTGNILRVSTCNGAGTDTRVRVHCGTCSALTCVNGNDDVGTVALTPASPSCSLVSGFPSIVQFCSKSGTTYLIEVGLFSATTTPTIVDLSVIDTGAACTAGIDCAGAGTCGNGDLGSAEGCDDGNLMSGDGCSATCTNENELCASARTMPSAIPWDDVVNTTAAAADPNPPNPVGSCNTITTTTNRALWYRWTPIATTCVTATLAQWAPFTATSSHDSMLTVWTGTCPSPLTQVACANASTSTGAHVIETTTTWAAIAGTTYYIQIGTAGSSTTGARPTLRVQPDATVATGRCCTSGVCSITTSCACTGGGGTYAGDGTTCATGRCCTSGVCTLTDPCACSPGVFAGQGTTCATGACCNSAAETCSIVTACDCASPATYLGDGSTCAQCPSDTCAGAQSVSDGTPAATGNNCSAGAVDDAEATCQSNSNKDVWYSYTATCTGAIRVTTEGSAQSDTVLSAYTSCGGTSIGCDDDTGTGLLSDMTVTGVLTGQIIPIRVASYSTGCGGFNLNIVCIPSVCGNNIIEAGEICDGTSVGPCTTGCAPNCHCAGDDCAYATVAGDGVNPIDRVAATTDGPLEPAPPCDFPVGDDQLHHDVWLEYTASCTGRVLVDTCNGAALDTRIAVYGECVCPPTSPPLACNDDSGAADEISDPDQDPDLCMQGGLSPYESATRNQVVSGTCYLIRVGSFSSSSSHAGIDELFIQCVTKGACCRTDNTCVSGTIQSECDALGGTFLAGQSCDGLHACCLPNDTCQMLDPLCCANAMGTPHVGATCSPTVACCFGGDCQDLDPLCCADANGTAAGAACEGDVDGDMVDGQCGDACPDDPNKTQQGVCGCGIPDTDTDLDGVADCNDNCDNVQNPGQEDSDMDGAGDACDCGDGILAPIEQCDEGAANGTPGSCCSATCTLVPAGTTCRPSAGVCDLAEMCTGQDSDCPADGFESNATICRPSGGICDVAENCPGNGPDCPADGKVAAGTTCRPSAGACDVAEACDGTNNACPADGFASNATVCRASGGVCDVAENCPGNGPNCPADGKVAAGTTCRPSAGACDVAETCDGMTNACPADGLAAAGTQCRASAGSCDVAESCTGASSVCPADGFAAAGVTCRAAAGACDVAETCSGQGPDCPADGYAAAGTTCRGSAGVCDVAESCTGSGSNCPNDGFAPPSQVCRASAGVCDAAENCTGSGAGCPADGFVAAGQICRPQQGVCDAAEACTGQGPDCPSNGFQSGTVCRPSTGVCDPQESCPGDSIECPTDGTITTCVNGDGCCPVGCCGGGISTDDDCPPDCDLGIPTVSEWGLAILTLLLLVSAKLYFHRRGETAVA